jgi:hypothetical protein
MERTEAAQDEIKVSFGRGGVATLRLAADNTRLRLALNSEPEGFDKSALNGLIRALEGMRERMSR